MSHDCGVVVVEVLFLSSVFHSASALEPMRDVRFAIYMIESTYVMNELLKLLDNVSCI